MSTDRLSTKEREVADMLREWSKSNLYESSFGGLREAHVNLDALVTSQDLEDLLRRADELVSAGETKK